MYGGLMDPDFLRLAQDQMNRLRPEDLQKMQQQMMSNPDILRMATEGMKNMRPEDIRMAADQMRNMRPDQVAEMSERMARASPEDIASMKSRSEAFKKYEYQGALTLKNQGNALHGAGKYAEAAEKYSKAKSNLVGQASPDAVSLRLTCSLNLMSCFLKTKQFQQAVTEGSEVLQSNPDNLKALYRRGQAYKELARFELAIEDLKRASELAPEDDTIADVLRQTEKELDEQEPDFIRRGGPLIEEITDEEAERFTSVTTQSPAAESNGENVDNGGRESRGRGGDSNGNNFGASSVNDHSFADSLNILKQNPEMIRSMHTMMSSLKPEHVAELSGGGMSSEMAKMTSDMMKQMSPEELHRMIDMASSMKGQQGSSTGHSGSERSRQPNTPVPVSAPSLSMSESRPSAPAEQQPVQRPETSRPFPSMPELNGDMQEQLRKQMKDPAMMQMMASMMKSMTPDMMASMGEQLGIKLSPEEAAQAQKAMSSLSPDELDRLMRWAERAQRLAEQAKRVKNWLVQRPGLVLAVVLLIVAIILHYFGVIGG